MKNLESSNISITILPPATASRPVDGRRYTLIHTKHSNHLHLSIGDRFDNHKYSEEDRKILAFWTYQSGFYLITVTMNLDDHLDGMTVEERNDKIEKYLTIIVLGDIKFYKDFPWLLDAPIYVKVDSDLEQYKQPKYFSTPRKLLLKYKRSSSLFV